MTSGDPDFDQTWALEAAPVAAARQLFDAETRVRIGVLRPFLLSGGDGRIELEVHRHFERQSDAIAAIDTLLDLATRAVAISHAMPVGGDPVAELAEVRRLRKRRHAQTVALFVAAGVGFAVVLGFLFYGARSLLADLNRPPTPSALPSATDTSRARSPTAASARSAASSVTATPGASSR
jgi:hypothetical protein